MSCKWDSCIKVIIHAYHFDSQDEESADYYLIINLGEKKEINEEDATNLYYKMKDGLDLYLQLNETDSDPSEFRDINGNAPDIKSCVFYQDLLTEQYAQRNVYYNSSEDLFKGDFSVNIGGYENSEEYFNESQSIDKFTLNGIAVDMRWDGYREIAHFFMGSAGEDNYVHFQHWPTYSKLLEEDDMFRSIKELFLSVY